MSDLSDYHSDKDEIARLNKQVDMMADFYKSFYQDQIKALTSKYMVSMKRTSLAKNKNAELVRFKVGVVRSLLTLKNKKVIDLSMRQIAEVAFTNLSYTYKIKKELGL